MMKKMLLVLALVAAGVLSAVEPPIFIEAGRVPNMRDLGGWKGLDGRIVKTGQIYRSAGLNDNASSKKVVENGVTNKVMKAGRTRIDDRNRALLVDRLGIRTDIDLRSDWEVWGMTNSPLGEKVAWVRAPIGAYWLMTPARGRPTKNSQHYKIFKILMDPAQRPVDFHCIAGRDRTGTVAMLLLAVLGVSEEDIVKDYLATPSCKPVDKWEPRIRQLVNEKLRRRYPADTLAESAAKYLENLGFTREEITAFRAQMLEAQ